MSQLKSVMTRGLTSSASGFIGNKVGHLKADKRQAISLEELALSAVLTSSIQSDTWENHYPIPPDYIVFTSRPLASAIAYRKLGTKYLNLLISFEYWPKPLKDRWMNDLSKILFPIKPRCLEMDHCFIKVYYMNLREPLREEFLKGWINRLNDVRAACKLSAAEIANQYKGEAV